MIVVMMGAAGAGKTTVGRALAAAAQWPFYDADDFHSAANIAKMAGGTPLEEADRAPWLAALHALIARLGRGGLHGVIACSALRESYRVTLADGVTGVHWVFLSASKELLADRLAQRTGHFAGTAILTAQLADLEPPAGSLTLAADQPVAHLVRQICDHLQLRCAQEG